MFWKVTEILVDISTTAHLCSKIPLKFSKLMTIVRICRKYVLAINVRYIALDKLALIVEWQMLDILT